MDTDNKMEKSLSDDEEDLEALRLAALQSLKKKVNDQDNSFVQQTLPCGNQNTFNGMLKGGRNRRFFPQQKRNCKSGQFSKGQFNNRVRNTNLISITPIQTEEEQPVTKTSEAPPKLILPQDRYSKLATKEEEKSEGPVSKFDRYDNSESESEDEDDSSSETEGTLKRADSLEELMKELEDEIQGESKPKEPKIVKVKSKKKKPIVEDSTNEEKSSPMLVSSTNEGTEKEEIVNKSLKLETEDDNKLNKLETESHEDKINLKSPDKSDNTQTRNSPQYSPVRNKQRLRSPGHRKTEFHNRKNRAYYGQQNPPFSQTNVVHNPLFTPHNSSFIPYNDSANVIPQVYSMTGYLPTNIPPPSVNYMHNHRSLSPLTINTDSLNNVITAPLSPRSAAFVMENRAIIEKRKRSPRRSYSRSPSPRSRHSSPPRRSFTPKRDSLSPRMTPPLLPRSSRRSPSPKRNSPPPRRYSRSPVPRNRSPRRSPSPPRRDSPSNRRYSPKRQRPPVMSSSKGSVYDRLGAKVAANKTESHVPESRERIPEGRERDKPLRRSRSRSRTPPPKPKKAPEIVDPVLEARRRKFETNEIKAKDGVIRLKAKDEEKKVVMEEKKTQPEEVKKEKVEDKKTTKSSDEETFDEAKEEQDDDDKIDGLSDLNEDELLGFDETLDLSPPVARLLSDEESDHEAEGRFKAKMQTTPKVPVLPFTKLINGAQSSEFKENVKVEKNIEDTKTSFKSKDQKRKRSRSPVIKPSQAKVIDPPTLPSKVKDVSSENRYEKRLKFVGRLPISQRTSARSEKPPITTPIESKKIEIRIRNPSKYRRADDEEVKDKDKDDSKCVYTSRKVEITKMMDSSSDSETEIIVENEEPLSPTERTANIDGDLRAQLSRKRAERQKRPESERSSRLLHSALDGAIFKKPKKSKKEKEAKKDVKLPIHLRLGIANPAELFTTSPKKKKSKKHRKRALEQV